MPVERFQWFTGAALAFALLATAAEWRGGLRWRRPAALALVGCLGLLLAACASEAYDLNEQARDAFAAGDVDSAIELLFDAQAEAPDDGRIALNLATALHAAERYDEAVQVARRALTHRDIAIVTAAYTSVGRHRFAQGQLLEALDAFGEALVLDPGNERTRRDYEVIYRLLNPPPPPPPSDGGDPPPPGEGGSPPPEGEDGPESQPGAGPDPSGAEPGNDDGGSAGRRTADELEAQLAAIDQEIATRRAAAGEVVSAQEALEILDLLEERSQLAAQRATGPRGVDADDY